MIAFTKWLMIVPLVFLLANCQKFTENDFTPGTPLTDDGSKAVLKTSGAVTADTVKSLPDMVIKFWWENLPVLPAGLNYVYNWNMGDGSKLLTTARAEFQYKTGAYQIIATATHPLSGTVQTRTMWVKISSLYVVDNTIIVLGYEPVTGGYDYHLGFKASTIYGYILPGQTNYVAPFITGSFDKWVGTPAAEYTVVNNEQYITKHFIFPNNSVQDLQFGQGLRWSYGINSTYWVSTSNDGGKYVIYPLNGKIYNFAPSVIYYPGEDGDLLNGSYPPTVRDSLMLGATSATDSLRVYINYQQYANGSKPFISYVYLTTWNSVPLKIIANTGWGYYTFSVASIKQDNSRLYFKFGPNLASPTQYGDMTQSKFYDATNKMCGLQLASTKSGSKTYSVTAIK